MPAASAQHAATISPSARLPRAAPGQGSPATRRHGRSLPRPRPRLGNITGPPARPRVPLPPCPVPVPLDEIDFEKGGGLVPVIVQDARTKDVLTLAYANRESLERTARTGRSWFWSRSRSRLWMKGEESGNTQEVRHILVDCDSDAVIYAVEPSGPACHKGERTCFHNRLATGEPPTAAPAAEVSARS